MVESKIKIEQVKLKDLKPYKKNPRFNDHAVEYVANSIKEFGFLVPIVVDKGNVIVAGHTRYKAAEHLGLTTVPVVRADGLTKEQAKAFRIFDNKSSEIAEWDYVTMKDDLRGIIEHLNPVEFGFQQDEIDAILDEAEFDESDSLAAPPKVKETSTRTVAAESRTVKISVGDINFFIEKEEYERWLSGVKEKAGYSKEDLRAYMAFDLLGFDREQPLTSKQESATE